MMSVETGPIPENGLLNAYARQPGCYTDCFYVDVPGTVKFSDYVHAFFNTPVFRLERKILGLFASSPSVDKDVADLASGAGDTLAMWKVEARDATQVIMAVGKSPIKTWLMSHESSASSGATRLYFGSAVQPLEHSPSGAPRIGRMFHIFLGFHKLYSRILLWSAKRNLRER